MPTPQVSRISSIASVSIVPDQVIVRSALVPDRTPSVGRAVNTSLVVNWMSKYSFPKKVVSKILAAVALRDPLSIKKAPVVPDPVIQVLTRFPSLKPQNESVPVFEEGEGPAKLPPSSITMVKPEDEYAEISKLSCASNEPCASSPSSSNDALKKIDFIGTN